MDTGVEYLKKLLDEIKNAGFWSRIFNWKQIRMLLPGAFADLQKLQTNLDNIQNQLIKADLNISGIVKERDFAGQMLSRMQLDFQNLERDNNENAETLSQLEKQDATNKETIINLNRRKQELESELAHLKNDMTSFRREFERISRMNDQFIQEEESRKKDHSHSMLILKEIKDKIESDRKIETDLQSQNEITRIFNLKETWSNHEENVKNVIKTIASKQGIDYVDKVPFKGTPDNTLKICDEFVILDAKSPASDDLSNFPSYLKDQSEKAGKYAREEDVKRDIFFVVPTNTLEALDHFVYRLAEYNVFIISIDALEPVILALQKLEAYEFAEQLSPEERENICRVLGRFGHLAKRRIQVDSFFIRQFMELAYMAESDLPKDILDQVVEFEKAEKLNPPVERRTKQISLKELEKDVTRLNSETTGKGIAGIENDLSLGLNKLPLHNEEITAS